MKRLKQGRIIVERDGMTAGFMPGREVSYESLLEADWEFSAPGRPLDDMLVRKQLMEKLKEALNVLNDEERELYYMEKTEREAACMFHVSQNTIHYRKKRILKKLKKELKKF